MEQKKLRSAWEIALERAEKLGQLSPEEMRSREEAQCKQIGESLASRYMSGLPLRDFQFLVNKYEGEAKEMVETAAALALVEALSIADVDSSRRAADALHAVLPGKRLEEKAEAAFQVVANCAHTTAARLADHQESIRGRSAQRLQDVGIAGTAVRLNLAPLQETQEFVEQVRRDFAGHLASLKLELRRHIGNSTR